VQLKVKLPAGGPAVQYENEQDAADEAKARCKHEQRPVLWVNFGLRHYRRSQKPHIGVGKIIRGNRAIPEGLVRRRKLGMYHADTAFPVRSAAVLIRQSDAVS
jgi:hypothetical protein